MKRFESKLMRKIDVSLTLKVKHSAVSVMIDDGDAATETCHEKEVKEEIL